MRIAIIGTGIAGNTVAYRLRDRHDITVFEAASHVGGHSHTVEVEDDGRVIAIDTGFVVFNHRTYPRFTSLLAELGQKSRESEMSFSVQASDGGLEYNGSSLNALFAQRRNILRPPFYRMVRDILRFNRSAASDLDPQDDAETVEGYVTRNGYSREFFNDYLVPMAAAIWSAEPSSVSQMPFRFLASFFENHGLLQLRDRPVWRVIDGGSREYVQKITAGHRDRIRLETPVRRIRRFPDFVEIAIDSSGTEHFDAVFIACHSDQALALLADPSPAERSVLGAIPYQQNEALLHTDISVLPRRRRAWAAWNYHMPVTPGRHVAITYNMNRLQGLRSERQYCVTLNNGSRIDESKIIKRMHYAHPVFSRATLAAQARHDEINVGRTYFCGAYWRNGFHEDGVVSADHAIGKFEECSQNAQLHIRRAG